MFSREVTKAQSFVFSYFEFSAREKIHKIHKICERKIMRPSADYHVSREVTKAQSFVFGYLS
ncbi:hypothetical protein BSF42_20650 [Flavobacterium sp. ACN6]|nr:hypothetical protein BSF42_20650 [Flavobacterium sp. ACN6]